MKALTRKSPSQLLELGIVGPEVVAPLRHAVSLVDDETAQLTTLVQRPEQVFQTGNTI